MNRDIDICDECTNNSNKADMKCPKCGGNNWSFSKNNKKGDITRDK